MEESIGKRIDRLRNSKGWSRARLGREMAGAIGRKTAFSGESVRRYEQGTDRPGVDARRALAKVFEKDEAYIEFGPRAATAREPSPRYAPDFSPDVERLLRAYSWLTDTQREELLTRLEADAATNKTIAKELGPKFDFASDKRMLDVLQKSGDFPPGRKKKQAPRRRPAQYKEEDPE